MYCNKCGNKIEGNVNFCPFCRNPISQIPEYPQGQTQENTKPFLQQNSNFSQSLTNNPNEKKRSFLLIVLFLLFVVIVLFGISRIMRKESSFEPNETIPENNTSNDKNNNGTNIENNNDEAVLLAIEDVYTAGSEVVVTGSILRGSIEINQEVQIVGFDKSIMSTVSKIAKNLKLVDSAEVGDNVGIYLTNVARDQVERGQVLAKKNSIKSSQKFEATIDLFSKEDGGRNIPIFTNYRSIFYFRTIGIDGKMIFSSQVDMISPGDKNVSITVELERSVAMEVGTEFYIRENGRSIGIGKVTKVY